MEHGNDIGDGWGRGSHSGAQRAGFGDAATMKRMGGGGGSDPQRTEARVFRDGASIIVVMVNVTLLHKIFYKALGEWPQRRLG